MYEFGRFVACVLLAAAPLLSACSGAYHLYWGDVHGHTALSDGKGTPDEYFAYARDESRLDFAILTDHDYGRGTDGGLSREEWDQIQDAAARGTERGRFIAIAGYEWTSQPKSWTSFGEGSEGLFDGPVRNYNHKNAYFPRRVPDIFRSKEAAYSAPDLLAGAVAPLGGLIHNNHPFPDAADQWNYTAAQAVVITNTEIGPDTILYQGKEYQAHTEQIVLAFLLAGGRTGFVAGSDTHEGHPAARTAVLARALTADALFEALRARRTYAITNTRIELDFRIDGHCMGEEFESSTPPRLTIHVRGTAPIAEVLVIREGEPLATFYPQGRDADLDYIDSGFPAANPAGSGAAPTRFYYVRVTQADADEHGNPSRAWSSPIWVTRR